MIAILALLSVGLTAPADGPFTIDLRPAFFSLDPQSIAESRAHATSDVDKFGSLHLLASGRSGAADNQTQYLL
jgi:hypothetical protein